jgi:hypothetical protein
MINIDEIYDDSNCFITEIYLNGQSVMVKITYENSDKKQVCLRIEMDGVYFNNLRVGDCTYISVYNESPIIDQFNDERCDVYLNTKFSDPIAMFNEINSAIKSYFGKYEIIDDVFYGGINTLVRGSGLLARCSLGYANYLKERFEKLDLSIISTKSSVREQLVMIDFGGEYLICKSYKISDLSIEQEAACMAKQTSALEITDIQQ